MKSAPSAVRVVDPSPPCNAVSADENRGEAEGGDARRPRREEQAPQVPAFASTTSNGAWPCSWITVWPVTPP